MREVIIILKSRQKYILTPGLQFDDILENIFLLFHAFSQRNVTMFVNTRN